MKRLLQKPFWVLVLFGWFVFIASHSLISLVAGFMDRFHFADWVVLSLFWPLEAVAVLFALLFICVGCWRLVRLMPSMIISVPVFFAAVAGQAWLGIVYFVFGGMFLYFKAAGHTM